MNLLLLRRKYNQINIDTAWQEKLAFLDKHFELLDDSYFAGDMLFSAAMNGNLGLVMGLLERGVNVNSLQDPNLYSSLPRAIEAAASFGHTEVVRYLIEQGSDINWESPAHPMLCSPLLTPVREGNFEIVKLLIEAGGLINAIDNNKMTPLDWAVGMKHTEIADYLRSKGAMHARELPGYVPPSPPPEKHPVVMYAESFLGYSAVVPWIPIIPDIVPVTIHGFRDEDRAFLFTQGMSERAMTVPAGGEDYQHAELVLPFDGWPEDDWNNEEWRWMIQWLRRVSQIPFENATWLGGQYGVISNEDPPQPLASITKMTCWLLLSAKSPFERLKMNDGRNIVFYTMLPIYTEERDYLFKHGLIPLLELFDKKNTPQIVVPTRECAVEKV